MEVDSDGTECGENWHIGLTRNDSGSDANAVEVDDIYPAANPVVNPVGAMPFNALVDTKPVDNAFDAYPVGNPVDTILVDTPVETPVDVNLVDVLGFPVETDPYAHETWDEYRKRTFNTYRE